MNRFKDGRVPLLERSSGFNLTTRTRERQRNLSDTGQLKVKSELSMVIRCGSNWNTPRNLAAIQVFQETLNTIPCFQRQKIPEG